MKQQFLSAIRPGGGATSYPTTATQIPASQTKIEQPGKNKSDYTDIDQQKGTIIIGLSSLQLVIDSLNLKLRQIARFSSNVIFVMIWIISGCIFFYFYIKQTY